LCAVLVVPSADPYLWLENVQNRRVRKWAISRSLKCRARLRPLSSKIEPQFSLIYDVPTILQVKVTPQGAFFLERREGAYSIRLEEETVVSSRDLGPDYVILYFYTDEAGERLAYFFSKGEDEGTMRLIKVASRQTIAEVEGRISSLVFLNRGFYYVKSFTKESTPDGTKPPADRVMRDGKVVFGEGVPTAHGIGVEPSHGKALVTIHQWSKTDVYFGDLDAPGAWTKVYGGDFLSYPIAYSNGELYVLSYEGKGYGRILRGGKVVVRETEEPIHNAVIVSDDVIVDYVKDCASHIRVVGANGREKISFEPPFKSTVELVSSDDDRALLVAASFGVPYAVYEFAKGTFRELDKLVVEDLDIRDGFVRSRDGTRVHYFEFGAGGRGVLAYGYGGFSLPRTPFYDPMLVQLARLGVTCVVSNLRGGNEYGEQWHRAGKRERKQNVFDDFAAVIGKFKKDGKKVVAFGRSNGGLLVGAVMTQHPELLDAAVIGYPVLDMLRFHRLSVGRYWVDEYGDPDRPLDRRYLLKYSPYHNVRKTHYPPTLIYTSLHDDRVHPGHGLKFAAKLEKAGAEVWLRVQAKGGHVGSSPQTRTRELSDVIAFVERSLA
jgi:prolyl oligopeptidase